MAPAWLRRVGDPEFWSLCALDAAGTVAGFACFGPARSSGTPAAFAAGGAHIAHVVALYVHPSHWRQSVATALLARAEEAMRTRGYGAARLWTPTGAPAERFYAARGWRPDGRSVWDGWLGLQLVGYAKRL
jgi:GNAT superfamily N-acetyltransferase